MLLRVLVYNIKNVFFLLLSYKNKFSLLWITQLTYLMSTMHQQNAQRTCTSEGVVAMDTTKSGEKSVKQQCTILVMNIVHGEYMHI